MFLKLHLLVPTHRSTVLFPFLSCVRVRVYFREKIADLKNHVVIVLALKVVYFQTCISIPSRGG